MRTSYSARVSVAPIHLSVSAGVGFPDPVSAGVGAASYVAAYLSEGFDQADGFEDGCSLWLDVYDNAGPRDPTLDEIESFLWALNVCDPEGEPQNED